MPETDAAKIEWRPHHDGKQMYAEFQIPDDVTVHELRGLLAQLPADGVYNDGAYSDSLGHIQFCRPMLEADIREEALRRQASLNREIDNLRRRLAKLENPANG